MTGLAVCKLSECNTRNLYVFRFPPYKLSKGDEIGVVFNNGTEGRAIVIEYMNYVTDEAMDFIKVLRDQDEQPFDGTAIAIYHKEELNNADDNQEQ